MRVKQFNILPIYPRRNSIIHSHYTARNETKKLENLVIEKYQMSIFNFYK